MKFRMAKLAVLSGLGLFVFWLLFQSTKSDVDRHMRTVARFQQLKQLDATLNMQVLQSRDGLLDNYDAIVQTQENIRDALFEFENETPEYFVRSSSSLSGEFGQVRELIDAKFKFVEDFKSHNAVLKNSLRYFPEAIQQMMGEKAGDRSLRDILHGLLNNELLYIQFSDEARREAVSAQLSLLEKQGRANSQAVSVIARHISIIHVYKMEVDGLMANMSGLHADAAISSLAQLYGKQYVQEERLATRYKQLLGLLTITLIGYVAWMFARLNKARNELKESLTELEFQKFTLDQHAIVSIADRSGRIMYTNDKFSEISKFDRSELLGQDHRLLNSGYHPREFFVDMWKTIGSGKVWHGEVCNRAKDGTLYWVDSTIVPFMDANGRPIRYVSIRTDITPRKMAEKLLEEQRLFLESITEALGEGVYAQDAEGRCIYMNSEAEHLLGWSRSELIGKSVHDTIHTHTSDGRILPEQDCPIILDIAAQGLSHRDDQVFVRKDGSRFPVALSSRSLVQTSGRVGAVVAFTDITARKEVEKAMREAKEAAEAASRAKGEFLANMSHEIRTPMNGIIGMTGLALGTRLDAEQREYIELVKSSADALLEIINDILDFSKIEAGKLDLEAVEFCVPDLLSETARSIAHRAHQKGLELILDIDPELPEILVGDPVRLRQIITNLVGNAIKFTEQGEVSVKLTLVTASTTSNRLKLNIKVQDTGIGIPQDKLGAIFESFSQADNSTTRKYGGTGLGLSITMRLVELMGGVIWVESEVGKGSSFYVEVALDRADVGPRPSLSSGQLQGKNALVIDDNVSNRNLICDQLRRWGMHAVALEEPGRTIAEVERARADGAGYLIVLFDARMPGVDSFAAIRELMAHPEFDVTPIVMLTTEGQSDEAARYRSLGVRTLLLKPYSQSDLFDACMNALGLSEVADGQHEGSLEVRHNKRKLHILLAEDNNVNQILATRLLQKFGHSIDVAENGLVAFEKWQSGQYDLILMDVDMPELNGFDATGIIRETEEAVGGHIPIIGLTAHAMQGSREECLAAGMDGYLTKPIDTEALWAELESIGGAIASTATELRTESRDANDMNGEFRLDRVIGAMNNDMELFGDLVRLYLKDYPGHVEKLENAIGHGDAKEVRHWAHTLKGNLSVFRVEPLVQVAERIERHSTLELSADLALLKQGLSWLESELRKHL